MKEATNQVNFNRFGVMTQGAASAFDVTHRHISHLISVNHGGLVSSSRAARRERFI
ncbi:MULTISPECIES: hypothetical protein [unclassified Sphingobium]|uniref:hypothetical protein n=1 Tax=unclassified Sphingobium TaxID=2611147 RepID=UPI002224B794|nr:MULTISPECIES: hypothetical protein [unclassified Sphingobium]MCW2381184.1 hypothetical protein [Sphingobium sp. B2D3B]MCW2388674.1 hypothetical protein [Sphingobium sp. B11D3B]MCW2398709.1 hypothetical protein [Sphingobium sp. B2D3C]